MAHDVFISHSTKDKQTADAVCHYLEQNGIRCRVEPRDIIEENDWANSVGDLIIESRLMVLVFSSSANESDRIEREVTLAAQKGIPVILFRIEDVPPSKLFKFFIYKSRWVDAATPPPEQSLQELLHKARGLFQDPYGRTEAAICPPEQFFPSYLEDPLLTDKEWDSIFQDISNQIEKKKIIYGGSIIMILISLLISGVFFNTPEFFLYAGGALFLISLILGIRAYSAEKKLIKKKKSMEEKLADQRAVERGELSIDEFIVKWDERKPYRNQIADSKSETKSKYDENVQFTVFQPKTVKPNQWSDLVASAHLEEKRSDAKPGEPEPAEKARRKMKRIFDYLDEAEIAERIEDSRQAIPQGGEITFIPQVDGVEFNPPQHRFLWQEDEHTVHFRLRASAELDGKIARGRMSVFLGAILVTDLTLKFSVNNSVGFADLKSEREAVSATPYRKIFASYSHKDQEIVKQFERYAEAFGDEYLRDVKKLRSGEKWNKRLLEMIDEADVFQLFWSRNAMESPYVRQEWEYALTHKGEKFVRPVYWENPFPERPPHLPPPQLRTLHFQRLKGLNLNIEAKNIQPEIEQNVANSTEEKDNPTIVTEKVDKQPVDQRSSKIKLDDDWLTDYYIGEKTGLGTGNYGQVGNLEYQRRKSSLPQAQYDRRESSRQMSKYQSHPFLRLVFRFLLLAILGGLIWLIVYNVGC